MTNNPYAPPIASLEVTETAPAVFYVVSKRKFLLLFLMTQGWYLLYWFYRNWKLYRAATGTQVMPKVRAIFAIFFVYSLFTRIDRHIYASGRLYSWYPRGIALVFIVLNLLAVGQMWLIDLQYQLALGIISTMLQMCCLFYVQNATNHAENDPEGLANSTLTFANAVWMLLGLCTWALLLSVAYLMPAVNLG